MDQPDDIIGGSWFKPKAPPQEDPPPTAPAIIKSTITPEKVKSPYNIDIDLLENAFKNDESMNDYLKEKNTAFEKINNDPKTKKEIKDTYKEYNDKLTNTIGIYKKINETYLMIKVIQKIIVYHKDVVISKDTIDKINGINDKIEKIISNVKEFIRNIVKVIFNLTSIKEDIKNMDEIIKPVKDNKFVINEETESLLKDFNTFAISLNKDLKIETQHVPINDWDSLNTWIKNTFKHIQLSDNNAKTILNKSNSNDSYKILNKLRMDPYRR